ncbi:MAG TPA: hypothetical protein DGG95_08400 [Cytophagales bacterium]|jgi:periplasmic protein TonB|nr:hypothetical protein [Cytophagales bacterium]
MRKTFLFLFLLLLLFLSLNQTIFAQSSRDTTQNDSSDYNKVFTVVDQSAEPIDGMTELNKWLIQNMQYPEGARRMGLEGINFVKFIVEPDGSITNVMLSRGFDGACDREAVRLISIMPKWKPGMQGGRPVRQAYTIPVRFRLDVWEQSHKKRK